MAPDCGFKPLPAATTDIINSVKIVAAFQSLGCSRAGGCSVIKGCCYKVKDPLYRARNADSVQSDLEDAADVSFMAYKSLCRSCVKGKKRKTNTERKRQETKSQEQTLFLIVSFYNYN